MRRPKNTTKYYLLLSFSCLAICMLLAACGGDSATPNPNPNPTVAATARPTAVAKPTSVEFTVVELRANTPTTGLGSKHDYTAVCHVQAATPGPNAGGAVHYAGQIQFWQGSDASNPQTLSVQEGDTITIGGQQYHVLTLSSIAESDGATTVRLQIIQ